jgi:Cu(I)/Ag(I) efflux system membrane fusion protein
MDTEVDVPNPGLVLVPGMYAEVNLTTEKRAGALTVPVSAVDTDSKNQNAGTVMVVNPEGTVEVRNVTLGLETSDSIEVRSGLRQGEQVILSNRSGFRAGEHVRPKLTTLDRAGLAEAK